MAESISDPSVSYSMSSSDDDSDCDPVANHETSGSEMTQMRAKQVDVPSLLDRLEWWKNHQFELPNWSRACKTALLIQPSSAAAERVFSLLNNTFKDSQASALEDYIETSLMVQYNGRK